MNIRLRYVGAPSPKRKRAKVPSISEHALQKQIVGYLTHALQPPVWWSAIDHAGKLGPRQAAARKARGVKRGIADFLVMAGHAYGPRVVWIELKRPGGGSLSPEQKEFGAAMARCGVPHFVCRSLEEVEAAIAAAGVPLLKTIHGMR